MMALMICCISMLLTSSSESLVIFCEKKYFFVFFFFSSSRRHARFDCDWGSDVCSSDLQLGGAERLVQEVVGSEIDRLHLLRQIVERSEDDDRQEPRPRRRFQLAADAVAVAPRHHDVQQDQVGELVAHREERLFAVLRLAQRVAERL